MQYLLMTVSANQMSSQNDISESLGLDHIAKVYYGKGTRRLLEEVLASYSNIIIVCSTNGRKRIEQDPYLFAALEGIKIVWIDSINSYPTIGYLNAILNMEDKFNVDVILGIGGGSVLDVAKTISVLLPVRNQHMPEKICKNPEILDFSPSLPTILLPTTCGTGSEVTPFATLWDEVSKSKLSLSHKSLLPAVVIGDPDLLAGLNSRTISSTALDALIQNLESLWNINATPKSKSIALAGLTYSLEGLELYGTAGLNHSSANLLLRASLFSGAAIAITRTAICHAVSYPLTSRFGVPHGFACAFSLISVLSIVLKKSSSFTETVTRSLNLTSEELIELIRSVYLRLSVGKTLRVYLPSLEEVLALSDEMFGSIRSRNTIISIDGKELESIIKESYSLMRSAP